MAKYLDESGLKVLWSKIKNTFTTKTEFSTLDTTFAEVVQELPTSGIKRHLYLKAVNSTGGNIYTEYLYTGKLPIQTDSTASDYSTNKYDASKWEEMGKYKAEVDLSGYLKTADAANTYATKSFSKIAVGATTVEADSKTDTLTLAGSNVTLTPDATNDKVTIGITKTNVTTALGYTPMNSTVDVDTCIKVGAVNGTDNAAATNGNVYINAVRNNTAASSNLIKGTDGTTVTSDASGTITIKSPIINVMGAATATSAGLAGYVPTPAAGKQASFLRGDGTWAVPTDTNTHYASSTAVGATGTTSNAVTTNGNTYIKHIENGVIKSSHKIWGAGATKVESDSSGNICITSTDTTYSAATTSANGLMSAADKTKLNGIATGATADSAIATATIEALS